MGRRLLIKEATNDTKLLFTIILFLTIISSRWLAVKKACPKTTFHQVQVQGCEIKKG